MEFVGTTSSELGSAPSVLISAYCKPRNTKVAIKQINLEKCDMTVEGLLV